MNPDDEASAEDLALADGFARQAGRWAEEAGADGDAVAALRQAARSVSLAVSSGHVCAELGEIAAGIEGGLDAAGLRQRLLACGVVATADAPGNRPLVVDADDRLYLHRYFDYERRLAARLAEPGGSTEPPDAARRMLQRLFQARPDEPVDWQQVAVAMALLGPVTVISGGPGTGKTTTVVRLLACLLAADPGCRIALAAPTGKAAARLLEALRLRAAELPPALREALPTEAFTVHRLLGIGREPGRPRHHAGQPLALDALIVDEASMLDLALATRLFEALRPGARVVLLGDKDQLAAVEAGAVFAELSADPRLSDARRAALAALCGLPPQALEAPASPPAAAAAGLPDRVVWLRRNFRFGAGSPIGRLAQAINRGDVEAALEQLGAGDPSLAWSETERRPIPHAVADGYAGYFAALQTAGGDPARVSQAFARFRILCAVRRGPRGVEAVNALLMRRLRQGLVADRAEGEWPAGRPVMVLRNDVRQGLYNGDTGIALPGPGGRTAVWFEDGHGGFRAVSPLNLPEHQTAFASTVHKAQGSEFDTVALLLPDQGGRAVSRELLYTGLTRARSRALLVGSAALLRQAIASPTRRRSGLLARLREATAK